MKIRFPYTRFSVLSTLFSICFVACSEQIPHANYHVVPLPASIETDDAQPYFLDEHTQIFYPSDGDAGKQTAGFLASYIQQATGLIVPVGKAPLGADMDHCICLELSDTVRLAESYHIQIDKSKIRILAGSEEGLFRGVQTLRKSLPAPCENTIAIQFPAVKISDVPRFGYRGVMLDVARSFYPVEFIKKTIDMLALHNLNRLHLHLTDDQGWRIEIKTHPLLTEVGASRLDSVSGIYSGYYTQQEIRDIVEYAQKHFVTIIPEIDMPGHVEALLASYPEMGCLGGPYTIVATPGVRRDVLCVGNPKALQFMKDILTEVMDLFPSEYIHIGGDEVLSDRWEECPKCQQMIRAQNLKDQKDRTAEQLLQGWFNANIEAFLHSHGRKLIGWDEILDGDPSPQSTIMAWRSLNKGIDGLRKGHHVIMSPNSTLYFDYYQSVNIDTEPQAIGGCINAETVYRAKVSDSTLTSDEQARILGVQGNLWSAHVPAPANAEYMLLPRVTALAELAWCSPDLLDFNDFLSRIPHMQTLYKQDAWNFSPHLFDLSAEFVPDTVYRRLLVKLSAGADAEIRYTIDGSQPDLNSKHYSTPIPIDKDASLRAVAFTPNGLASDVFRKEIRFNKATLKSIELLTQPAPRYAENKLADGVRATTIYARGGWTGYLENDMVAVVDLGEKSLIGSAGISTLVDYGSHIMDAASIEIAVSEDGHFYTTVAEQSYPQKAFSLRKELLEHNLEFEPVQARFVRITAKKAEQLPSQMTATQGKRPFLFVDEIFVR